MIHLHRHVTVSSFDAQATVAIGRKRPEFLAVAQLAADLARPITPRDIMRELLGNRPEVLGRRVIARCISLGLLVDSDRHGSAVISTTGLQALEAGEVLVPEEGIWRFYLQSDPLLPNTLLHARRLETGSAHQERNKGKKSSNQNSQPQNIRSPERLRQCRAATPSASIADGQLLHLRELSERGSEGPSGTLNLSFLWEPTSSPLLTLTGDLAKIDPTLESPLIDSTLVPDSRFFSTYEGMWKEIAAMAMDISHETLDHWHQRTEQLSVPVSFSSTTALERKVFKRNIPVPDSDWGAFGEFESTTLKDAPILPASAADAQQWAQWLQWESIQDYVTAEQLTQITHAQLARFPYHQPRLPSPQELIAHARDLPPDSRRNFLLAPFDLGLWS